MLSFLVPAVCISCTQPLWCRCCRLNNVSYSSLYTQIICFLEVLLYLCGDFVILIHIVFLIGIIFLFPVCLCVCLPVCPLSTFPILLSARLISGVICAPHLHCSQAQPFTDISP